MVSASFVVVAAWYFGVHSRQASVDQLKVELESQTSEIEQGKADEAAFGAGLSAMIQRMEQESSLYRAAWAHSSDAAVLYRGFDEAAQDAGVRVVRLEPSKGGIRTERQGASIETHGFVVEVEGVFEGVMRFIRQVQYGGGMTRIKSIRLYPAADTEASESSVRAIVQSEHVSVRGLFEEDGP